MAQKSDALPAIQASEELKETKVVDKKKGKEIVTPTSPDAKQKKPFPWKRVLEYSLPSLIVLGILLIVFAINQIAPLGSGMVALIDYIHGLVPSYTYLWDVLHGDANLFFTDTLGGGSNMYASMVMNSFLSPLSWLIAIFPRTLVVYGIAFILVIKLMLIATTAYYMFKKLFKNVNKYTLLLFAIMWTFSSWMLVHVSNVGWFDLIIVFPLLVLAVKHVFETGKIAWFVALLTYCLLLSYYISYMILLGLVVVSIVAIIMLAKNKKRTAASLSFGIILAMLLSMICFAPSLIAGLSSFRISSGGTVVNYASFGSKLAILVMYPVFIMLFALLCKHFKQDKKNILCFIIIIGVLLIGLVFERINAMWHTGNYYSYPYRYSFIIIFTLIMASLYYLNKYKISQDIAPSKDPKLTTAFFVVVAVLFAMMSVLIGGSAIAMHPAFNLDVKATLIYCVFALLAAGLIFLALKHRKALTRKILVYTVCFIQVIVLSVGFMGAPDNVHKLQSDGVSKIDTSLMERPYRVKDLNNILYPNYPLIMDYPSLSTWIHISPNDQTLAYRSLGYQESGVVLNDSGGTLFSDMLLGVRYYVSTSPMDATLFTLLDQYKMDNGEGKEIDVYLYQNDCYISYMTLLAPTIDFSMLTGETPFELQNNLYKLLTNTGSNIINELTYTKSTTADTDGYYTISVDVVDLSNIHFYSASNDKAEMPGEGDSVIKLENGIYDLGIHENETVTFKIKSKNLDDLVIGAVEIADIIDFSATFSAGDNFDYKVSGNKISIDINATAAGEKLFIPLTYLKDYTCTINGKAAEIEVVLQSFCMVTLDAGANSIEISFTPQFFNIGWIVSLVTLAVVIILFLINLRFKFRENKVFNYIGLSLGCAIVLVIAFMIYLKPIALTFTDIF